MSDGPPELFQPPFPQTPDLADGAFPAQPVSELFCWGIILAIVAMLFALNWFEQNQPVEHDPERRADSYGEVRGVEFQTRVGISVRNLGADGGADPAAAWNPEIDGNTGPLWQRYATTVQIAELEGPAAAVRNLRAVDAAVAEAGFQPDAKQKMVRHALGKVLEARAESDGRIPQGGFAAEDVETLTSSLGWLGQVVTTPATPGSPRPGIDDRANRLLMVFMVAALVFVGLLAGSIAAFAVATWLFSRGRLPSAMIDQSGSGSLYIETFAVWMVLFLVLPATIVGILGEGSEMIAGPLGMFGSLLSLTWPVIRGRPWATVRRDIGLEFGNPFREILCGLFGYLCTLVLLGLSLVILVPLMILTAGAGSGGLESQAPLHPIQDRLMSGDPQAILMVFVLACVIAPVLEETLFRGVLYRYLRDRTGSFRRWKSVLVSLLANALIFALIHPQNLLGLLPLSVLATGMTLVRQWRSSLLASMTLHAVNNSLATTAMLVTLV